MLQDPRGFVAKLSDFGLSIKMKAHGDDVSGIKYGTVQYLAPETLRTHVMTKKADVYSFGLIMWELWHSKLYAEMYNYEKKKRGYAVHDGPGTCFNHQLSRLDYLLSEYNLKTYQHIFGVLCPWLFPSTILLV